MPDRSEPPRPAHGSIVGDAMVVYDADGGALRVPLKPTGADLDALERQRAREQALRPLEALLLELEAVAGEMLELERGRGS